ncbi:unnamed protein product, partial [Closterium sp. NIES-53]
GRERYFLLVFDEYTRYTTVFPLRSKGEVPDVLIPWIRAVLLQLRERFCQDLPVLRQHYDRGGEFSSDLLRDFCRGEGILHSFTLPASPQQNGIAEHYIGLVMELNLWPRVSLPEISPTLRWTGELGDASVFWVWGSHPLPSTVPVEVAVDSGVARGAASGVAASRGVEPGGAESEGAGSGGAEPGGAEPGGAEPQGTASSGGPSGASPRLSLRPEPLSLQQLREWFAQRTRLRSGAAGAGDSAAGDTGAGGVGATRLGGAGITAAAGGTGGAAAAGPGGARTRGTGSAGTGSVGGDGAGGAGAGDPVEPGGAGARGAGDGGTGAGGGGAGGAGAGDTAAVGAVAGGTGTGGAGAGGAGAGGAVSGGTGAGRTVRPQPFFVPLLCQFLSLPSSTSLPPNLVSSPPCQSQPQLQPGSPLPAPSPYAEQTASFREHREPESRPASPVRVVRTRRRVPRPRPPPVPGTHAMPFRPSSVPLRVPLPPPPESSLPAVPDPESDLAHAASLAVSRLLATVVTDPSFKSTAVSALIAELLDFAAAYRLDYATALVVESESASPPSVGGECALGMDVLEDRHEDFECLAAAVPHLVAMLLAPEGDPDAPDIPTPHSYAEAITGPYSS